ncbi:glyoxylase-like metal-dependent hydrolase (beta-lactamase superfamily II) [Variovorax boronicumulans]|uniref:MBL fold metallo-hydrolase n=1 Tax=Variovorax boronicumulans TaxID=436515 RepID=UPI0024765786|nr:MBL fold metallo-hydrolase [Variovorax boronicumulans]MDH6165761.1 glyoxylase-like metal-dependent hydrolase (beta-lactamase superfamily II) [Variovorax boronicumulans]
MTHPTHWLRRGLAALASSVLMLSFAAHAGAPQVRTQAPGFYRMMLGDFEVTALFDGTIDLEVKKLLTNTTQAQVGKLLDRSFKKDLVPTSVNSYLVNTGSKLVLIDTGAGTLFGPTLGNLRNNLLAAGYKPEQVDDVFITHMHGDHVGGLIVDGKLAFPNATIHAGQEDADFWLSKANLEKATPEMKGFFQGAQSSLNPYVEAGKFKPMKGDTDLLPGIKAVPAHGHTPGHNTYVLESKGQKLVLWGDLMHVASVQFVQPQVTISFDTDSKTAAAERKKAYADAAKGRYLVGSAHLPFPGLGRIRAEGSGYVWVPVDYQQVR